MFESLQDWLYWTDEITKSVYKMRRSVHADQADTAVLTVMSNLSSPHDVAIFHSLKQPQGSDSFDSYVNVKSFALSCVDLHFLSFQPDTGLHCQSMDMGLVHCTMCLFCPSCYWCSFWHLSTTLSLFLFGLHNVYFLCKDSQTMQSCHVNTR